MKVFFIRNPVNADLVLAIHIKFQILMLGDQSLKKLTLDNPRWPYIYDW